MSPEIRTAWYALRNSEPEAASMSLDLRPSELFGLTWECYAGNLFTIVNTAWRGRLQRKKINRKKSLRTHQLPPCRNPPSRSPGDLTCGGRGARTRTEAPSCSLGCKRVRERRWRRRFTRTIGCAC